MWLEYLWDRIGISMVSCGGFIVKWFDYCVFFNCNWFMGIVKWFVIVNSSYSYSWCSCFSFSFSFSINDFICVFCVVFVFMCMFNWYIWYN